MEPRGEDEPPLRSGAPEIGAEGASDVDPIPGEEFEDEPPGAYLQEGRLGGGAVAWSGFLVLAVVAVGGTGWWIARSEAGLGGPGNPVGLLESPEPEAPPFEPEVLRFPLRVAWTVLPVLAGFGFLVTLFIRWNQGPRSPREARLGSLTVNLHLAAVLIWLLARFFLGIDFRGPDP